MLGNEPAEFGIYIKALLFLHPGGPVGFVREWSFTRIEK
jgi:hypothetical protein